METRRSNREKSKGAAVWREVRYGVVAVAVVALQFDPCHAHNAPHHHREMPGIHPVGELTRTVAEATTTFATSTMFPIATVDYGASGTC